MRAHRVLLGILLVVALAACGNAAAAGAGDALVGHWVPAGGAGSGAPHRPFADLAADGTFTGSDGCNTTKGTWSAGPGATLRVSTGPSTLMGCADMVPVPTWFALAVRTAFDGPVLVLVDGAGAELGRVERTG